MIDPSELASLVGYAPETGALFWLPRNEPRFDTKLAWKPAFSQIDRSGYMCGRLRRINMKAHRVAWAVHHGNWPDGYMDHINGDRRDNRLSNLRVVSLAENGKNQRPRRNSSGEQCVNWFARDSKWWVKITINGRQTHVGYFDEFADAVAARDAAYKEHGFHENHGR